MADVTVRIAADNSELKSVVQDSSRTVKEMGGSFKEATGEVNRAGMEVIRISSHITGEAIPGFSRLSREIASVGAEAIGIGPMLAAAIPIAALVGGVALMEHFAEASEKVKRADTEWAVEGSKLNDKLMEEKEHLIGLTVGPLAEAEQKTKDFSKTTSDLAQVIAEGDKRMEAHIGTIARWTTNVEKAWMEWEKFMHVSDAIPITDAAFKEREQDIVQQYESVGKLTEALKAYQNLLVDIQKGGGALAPVLAEQAQADIARIGVLQQTAAMHQKALTAEQEAKRVLGTKTDEEMEKEQRLYDLKVQHALDIQAQARKTQTTPGVSDFPTIGPETKGSDEGLKSIEILREATRTQWDQLDEIVSKGLDQRLRYVQQNAELIQAAELKMWNSIKASSKNAMDTVTQNVTSQTMSWMRGQETFKTAALRMWVGIAESAIQNLMKIGIADLEALAMHKSTGMQERLDNAKTAAGAAYKAEVGIPVVGPALGAAAAAVAFAAVMAFERGGISEGGLSMLHPREMVLPPYLSEFVMKSAAAAVPGGEGGGGGDHRQYDFSGMSVHTANPADFVEQLKDAMRKGKLRF